MKRLLRAMAFSALIILTCLAIGLGCGPSEVTFAEKGAPMEKIGGNGIINIYKVKIDSIDYLFINSSAGGVAIIRHSPVK